eukprot:TRINITY_DN7474_c0_g5_i1.p4 TRINITY_DN7474_c0_g5~~TRINITY_DN7474_c0_g5_i1.p4  ORF type:complete len:104 (+),score=7.58 TRINITY_DN7474_c0_g5_i1:1008-1319(+)
MRQSTGHYAVPTLMHDKKDSEGNYTDKRMCGNNGAPNVKTLQDKHVMPLPDNIFGKTFGCLIFAIIDQKHSFNQIELWEGHKHTRRRFGVVTDDGSGTSCHLV